MNLKASVFDYSVERGARHEADAPSAGGVMSSGNAVEAASDEDLLLRAATGDETAFARLYERYGVSVYNYILRLIHEPSAAENLLQDTFVAVWEGAAGFGGRAKARTWIFRIAHHRTVDWMRREGRRDVVEEAGAAAESNGPATRDEDPEHAALRASEERRVRRALDRLSPEHRGVVELTFYAGLPYAEIAEIMDCPVGTVKSRMSWARTYLAKALEEDEGR